MHIERRIGIGWRELNVLVQRLAGKVGERRLQLTAVAGVAPGALIQLPVAGESRRVQDGRGGLRVRLLLLYVFPSRAMTLFALDAEGISSVAVAVGGRRKGLKIGRVALQAARNDSALEICKAVAIAGAVHPA